MKKRQRQYHNVNTFYINHTYNIFMVQVDQRWINSTLLDALTSVPDYEECEALCRVIKINNIYIIIIMLKYVPRTGSGARVGPGYQKTFLPIPTIA